MRRATLLRQSVIEEARQSGLLAEGEPGPVSIPVPAALVEAAMRETGITSPSELAMIAIAMLAQPDPVAEFMRETRGCLGPDHALDG